MRGIVQIAETLFLRGDASQARRHANNVWLSSAPHELRQRAWKVLFLVDDAPRELPAGHQVVVTAPGSRDHVRFKSWLRDHYLVKPWVRDIQTTYRPTLIGSKRASETALITFVIDSAERQSQLVRQLARPGSMFPTQRWTLVSEQLLGDIK